MSGGIVAPRALAAPENAAGGLTVKVLRADSTAPDGLLQARDLRGLLLGEAPFAFKAGELETEASFDLPVEIRNDIARIESGSLAFCDAATALSLSALNESPGGSIRPFCEPPTVTSTPQASCR